MNTLTLLSHEVANVMKKTPGLEYVDDSTTTGTPIYQLTIHQAALQQYGLTAKQVQTSLRQAFDGVQASTLTQGSTQTNVVVRFPESYSQNISNLAQITIPNGTGAFVPLTDIATLSSATQIPSISHTNGLRSVSVTAKVYGKAAGNLQRTLAAEFQHLRIPAGYSVNFGLGGRFLKSSFLDLGYAMIASIVLLYMVMASLFESFLTPFVIMFCLPPTFVGAALGLFLTGRSLDIDAMIGVIMVMGLIANNAIVLVDYTNQLRRQGRSLRQALLEAGPIRLRPILMSTLTTVLAMLPLVLGFGKGANTLSSMATVIAFGLTFSTLITLVLVPVMYVSIANVLSGIAKYFRRASRTTVPQVGA